MSSRDQTPLIGHLCPFSSPCSITISQRMRIVWNCDGSANLRWLFNGVLEKLRYQPASNRRGILRANDAVSVINDFRWIVEMARVKSVTEIWPNGMFARTNSNDFFGFQRENSLVTKHLCLTWDATVRITDSSPRIGHLSSGPSNCITNACSHCYSRG